MEIVKISAAGVMDIEFSETLHSIDHFFRIAKETRFTVPDDMKYFCVSEAVAYYLQNYVVYRKRKIFHGKQVFDNVGLECWC